MERKQNRKNFYVVEIILNDNKKYYLTWYTRAIIYNGNSLFLRFETNIDYSSHFDSAKVAEEKAREYVALHVHSLTCNQTNIVKSVKILTCIENSRIDITELKQL